MPSQATLKRKGNNRKEQQSAPNARFRSTSSPSDSAVMARKDARVFKKPRTEAPRSTDLVPEFDMRRLQSNDETLRRLAAKRFWELLKDRGAVWVRRHSIATEKIEQAFEWTKQVFEVDGIQSVTQSTDLDTPSFRGYDGPAVASPSKSGTTDEDRHLFSVGSTSDTEYPNIFPSKGQWAKTATFQRFVNNFHQELHQHIARPLLRALGVAANEELRGTGEWSDDILETWHSGVYNQLSLLKYEMQSKDESGVPDHTDDSTITLLMFRRPGLEMQDRRSRIHAPLPQFENDGHRNFGRLREHERYIPVPAHQDPAAVLILAGDFLEAWTHGAVKATRHRVRTKLRADEENYARYSIADFVCPERGHTIPHHLGWTFDSERHGYRYGGETIDEHMRARVKGYRRGVPEEERAADSDSQDSGEDSDAEDELDEASP